MRCWCWVEKCHNWITRGTVQSLAMIARSPGPESGRVTSRYGRYAGSVLGSPSLGVAGHACSRLKCKMFSLNKSSRLKCAQIFGCYAKLLMLRPVFFEFEMCSGSVDPLVARNETRAEHGASEGQTTSSGALQSTGTS
jgi:hypothetical protein